MDTTSQFAGFTPEFFRFLRELEKNNNRPWFEENKDRYDRAVRQPTLAFIRAMAPRLERISPYLVAEASQSGGSMMRIYRDVRFSSDKSPYKTHVGVCFGHERADDVHCPAFWLNAEKNEVFLAAGIWRPDGKSLLAVRRHIEANASAWQAVLADKRMRKVYGGIYGDSLQRPPRGFAPDHACIDDIRRKEFLVVYEDKPAFFLQPDLPDVMTKMFAAAAPLMKFLCDSLDLRW